MSVELNDLEAAKAAETVVLFIGLPDNMESEGVDRIHMRLPEGHNALVDAVCAANPNTVIVLHNGSPVEMPWVEKPKAILEAYLGGQASGEAVVSVLYGDVNPPAIWQRPSPSGCRIIPAT